MSNRSHTHRSLLHRNGAVGSARSRAFQEIGASLILALGVLTFASIPALALETHVFFSSFGGSGSEAGKLSSPAGVAVNTTTHDVYVADTGNQRIDEFEADGTFVRAFGANVGGLGENVCGGLVSCAAGTPGTAPGELGAPTFVAVDNDPTSPSRGDVYVAGAGESGESPDNVVSKFSSEGKLEESWGVKGQLDEGRTTGTGDYKALGSASGSAGKVTEGSPTITNVVTSTGAFAVGQGIRGLGIEDDNNHAEVEVFPADTVITAVGAGTLTVSNPAAFTDTHGATLSTDTVVTGLVTSVGAFTFGQTISGIGIPAETTITSVGSGTLVLSSNVTASGAGADLTAITGRFGQPEGIAVDTGGNLWIYTAGSPAHGGNMFEFAQDGTFVTDWYSERAAAPAGIAVDSSTSLYVGAESGVVKFNSIGGAGNSVENTGTPIGVAVDPSNNNLYVDAGSAISSYPAPCEPGVASSSENIYCTTTGSFGSGTLSGAEGMAVDSNHAIYVADTAMSEIDAFAPAVLPDLATGEVSDFDDGSVTLNGTVNPDGVEVTSCEFEYATAEEYASAKTYGKATACGSSPGDGSVDVAVSAGASGLTLGKVYRYRLVAGNKNGVNLNAQAHTFQAGAIVEGESVLDLGAIEASVSAQIDPGAQPATYHVEYGFTSAYGFSTPEASIGVAATGVRAQLSGLQPGANYHYRFVATDAFGVTDGADQTFTTHLSSGASSSALPDGRVYELVSPPGPEEREVYVPYYPGEADGSEYTQPFGEYPMLAAADGDAVIYVGDPEPAGNGDGGKGNGNEFVAVRAPGGGWSASDVTPSGSAVGWGIYQGFSSDLSVGVLVSAGGDFGGVLGAYAPGAGCSMLFTRALGDGAYQPLLPGEDCYHNLQFAGVAADDARVFFSVDGVLYESAGGNANVVSVSPEGEPAADSTFGGNPGTTLPGPQHFTPRVRNAISADGSRVFWTELPGHDLYVREDSGTPQADTVPISTGAEYQTASTEGSLVFFTKKGAGPGDDLYEFDVETEQTVDLAPGGEVQGVVGSSEDGSYVYFVGLGALKSAEGGALTNARAEEPQAGQDNLYVYHTGETQFIATLAAGDQDDWSNLSVWEPSQNNPEGDPDGNYHAEVTPDGQSLVFSSTRSLTAYDSGGASEVYVYDADRARVVCASCRPDGAPPEAGGGSFVSQPTGGFLSNPTDDTSLPRWISEDGGRVFFDSDEALVPQDVNGQIDVYEWEREGEGSCPAGREDGCVYLLSGGTSSENSFFIDASTTGDDAFLVTRAALVPEDEGDDTNLYDARVDGYQPLTSPLCTGAGCQGAPPVPPIFATPSSVTFDGIGNFPTPAPTVLKPPAKKKAAKCAKGKTRNKRGQCVKQKKSAKSKAKKSTHRKGSK